MEDVIRVRAYHFMGEQKKAPSFEIHENKDTKVLIEDNENEVIFKSGNTKMILSKEKWEMAFYKGNKKINL